MTVALSLRPLVVDSRNGFMGKPLQWMRDGSLSPANPNYVLPRE
jgi:hypothetical protein